jgi:hypothetical protein
MNALSEYLPGGQGVSASPAAQAAQAAHPHSADLSCESQVCDGNKTYI